MKSDTAIAATRCVVRRGLCLSARRTALLFSLAVIQMASADAPSWIDGLYVKGFGGLHFLQDGDLSRSAASGDGSYDLGQLFGAAIGKELTPNWALNSSSSTALLILIPFPLAVHLKGILVAISHRPISC